MPSLPQLLHSLSDFFFYLFFRLHRLLLDIISPHRRRRGTSSSSITTLSPSFSSSSSPSAEMNQGESPKEQSEASKAPERPMAPRSKELRTPQVFSDDSVVLKAHNEPFKLAMVMRASQESDSEDDSDDEDDDEEDKANKEERRPLLDGEIRVCWLVTGQIQILQESEVLVVDRMFDYGDGVCRKEEFSGQSGTVVNVRIMCDLIPASVVFAPQKAAVNLEYFQSRVIKNVNSRWLAPSRRLTEDEPIVFRNYMGLINDVVESLEIKFTDGSCCQVDVDDSDEISFHDIKLPGQNPVTPTDFFPGQYVSAPARFWRRARWTKGGFSGEKSGVITKLIPDQLSVQWIIPGNQDYTSQPPPVIHNLDKVDHFQCFAHTKVKLGDLAHFHPDHFPEFLQSENIDALPQSSTTGSSGLRKRKKGQAAPQPAPTSALPIHLQEIYGPETPVLILKTSCFVDVHWQNGEIEKDVPASELMPRLNVDDNDFWPGDFVEATDTKSQKKLGQIVKFDAKERTCVVDWLQEDDLEQVGVFEVKTHWDYNFQVGDLVARVTDFDYCQSVNENPEVLKSCYDILERRVGITLYGHEVGANDQKPYFGEVAAILSKGNLLVVWHNRTFSVMTPESLTVVDLEDYDGFSNEDEGWEGSEADEGWETYDEDEGDDGDDGDDDSEKDDSAGEGEEPETTHNDSDDDESGEDDEKKTPQKATPRTPQPVPSPAAATPPLPVKISPPQPDSFNANDVKLSEECAEKSLTTLAWEKFAIIEQIPADHLFISSKIESIDRSFLRRIQQEHKIFDSLPDGIVVRGFEDRTDLFRALIFGPKETPYESSVFLFDIRLPGSYPTIPPEIFFHSWTDGMGRVNPNLYEEGKVCLSLLGTWFGKGNENWSTNSNVLQILISLQGLVLVKEPYYNEAGFEKQVGLLEGEMNSKLYNEKAFLLSMKFIVRALRYPPKPFAPELADFYLRQGNLQRVVLRCENLINQAEGLASSPDPLFATGVSKGCAISLKRPLVQLKALLQQNK